MALLPVFGKVPHSVMDASGDVSCNLCEFDALHSCLPVRVNTVYPFESKMFRLVASRALLSRDSWSSWPSYSTITMACGQLISLLKCSRRAIRRSSASSSMRALSSAFGKPKPPYLFGRQARRYARVSMGEFEPSCRYFKIMDNRFDPCSSDASRRKLRIDATDASWRSLQMYPRGSSGSSAYVPHSSMHNSISWYLESTHADWMRQSSGEAKHTRSPSCRNAPFGRAREWTRYLYNRFDMRCA